MTLVDYKDVATPELVDQAQSQAVAKVIVEIKKLINSDISLDEWAEFASPENMSESTNCPRQETG